MNGIMTPLEFTQSYLGEHRLSGDEIQIKFCPFCNGGQHNDKYTFAINATEEVYKCLRGSCNASGHFNELLRAYGINTRPPDMPHRAVHKAAKKYKKPETIQCELTDKALKYIQLRGLTEETANRFGLSCDSDGNIVFPYYQSETNYTDKQPTFIKFRKPEKIQKGEKKMWRESDTEPILFGMHLCKNTDTLYLFEGEFDCMVGYQASGCDCVSVPSGCDDFTWIDTCYDWLMKYDRIAVFADNDNAGMNMLNNLSTKLDNVCQPAFELYGECKDCNEIYIRHGSEVINAIMESMDYIPIQGLINLANVRRRNIMEIPRTLLGMPELDKTIGGMLEGDFTVWTGKRGMGKSTFLGQVICETINQDVNVCVYSGEVPADRFRYFLDLQAAGHDIVQPAQDKLTGREYYYVPEKYAKLIEQWYDRRIWLYDSKIAQADEREAVMNLFTLAYKRYDCKVFIVDNLMTINTATKAGDYMEVQADFAVRLRKLAENLGVHIHLVVHPRKGAVKDADDVGGMGTITNSACTVFDVCRFDEAESKDLEAHGSIRCMKARAFSERKDIFFNFNPASRRYTEKGEVEKHYKWRDLIPKEAERPCERSEPPF